MRPERLFSTHYDLYLEEEGLGAACAEVLVNRDDGVQAKRMLVIEVPGAQIWVDVIELMLDTIFVADGLDLGPGPLPVVRVKRNGDIVEEETRLRCVREGLWGIELYEGAEVRLSRDEIVELYEVSDAYAVSVSA